MSTQTTREVAEHLKCSRRKVREMATALGVGFDLGGRAGFRFSEADVQRLKESMRLIQPVEAQDPRGRRQAS